MQPSSWSSDQLDDTPKKTRIGNILRKLRNDGIIQNETNLGYRKNFENVIANTKGDIIFLSDQDDVWLEEKVKTLINDLEQDGLINLKGKNCTGVMGKTIFYSSNGNSYNFEAIQASDCASDNIGK